MAAVQGRLTFVVRAERRERAFRRGIVGATAAVVMALIAGTPGGRFVAREVGPWARGILHRMVGLPPDRERVVEALHRAQRERDMAAARRAMRDVATPGSAMAVFLKAARMDADSAVIRWGNVDRSIVLSSAVFEADDARSYHLRPGVRSVWVIGISIEKALGIFLIPDTAEARTAASGAGGTVVPESVQVTNSWGCRGPEPDLMAPVRVLVLGDSMMQGALVGDAESPPARLQAHLAETLEAPVSVLNTGHLGYSPEQYYRTLVAFGDRFRPHYVVISLTDNDFGQANDWDEAGYWVGRIADLCNNRGWPFLLVPAPPEPMVLGRRDLLDFQSQVMRIFKRGGVTYMDPLEFFTDALLTLQNEGERRGVRRADPLYNLHLMGDRHFSPTGSDLWARVVGRRLLLVWEKKILAGLAGPEPVTRHARSGRPAWPCDRPRE